MDPRSPWNRSGISHATALMAATVGCSLLFVLSACETVGRAPPTSGATTTAGTSSGTTAGGTTSGGPTFLSFGANTLQLTAGQRVDFSAVLTTPDGAGDLVGGKLTSPDGQRQYGGFDAGAQKGAYTLALSWDEINQTLPINFASDEKRTFLATFYDAGGASAGQSITIELTCKGSSACDGKCFDLTSDPMNCGSCGNVCHAPLALCDAGQCRAQPGRQACIAAASFATCDDYCASIGLTCGANACQGLRNQAFGSSTCDPNAQFGVSPGCGDTLSVRAPYARCCCG